MLPWSYNATPHNDLYAAANDVEKHSADFYGKTEAEFQISFKIPVYRRFAGKDWDILAAYTHHSWWQVYNSAWSKPFRETNYNPEIFTRKVIRFDQDIPHLKLVAYDFGYMHQSNGQIQVLSRSWDRIFGRAYFLQNDTSLILTAWLRLPESTKDDDNPGIIDYMGVGQVEFIKNFGRHTLKFQAPIQFSHVSIDVKYTYPWREHLRWMASFEYGYAHSLIEYDRSVTRFAVGIALENFWDKDTKNHLPGSN